MAVRWLGNKEKESEITLEDLTLLTVDKTVWPMSPKPLALMKMGDIQHQFQVQRDSSRWRNDGWLCLWAPQMATLLMVKKWNYSTTNKEIPTVKTVEIS